MYLFCNFVGELHASLLYIPSQALEIDPIYLVPHLDKLCSAATSKFPIAARPGFRVDNSYDTI
jgi:hypothetical protein